MILAVVSKDKEKIVKECLNLVNLIREANKKDIDNLNSLILRIENLNHYLNIKEIPEIKNILELIEQIISNINKIIFHYNRNYYNIKGIIL